MADKKEDAGEEAVSTKKVVKNATDLQRLKLEKLLKDPVCPLYWTRLLTETWISCAHHSCSGVLALAEFLSLSQWLTLSSNLLTSVSHWLGDSQSPSYCWVVLSHCVICTYQVACYRSSIYGLITDYLLQTPELSSVWLWMFDLESVCFALCVCSLLLLNLNITTSSSTTYQLLVLVKSSSVLLLVLLRHYLITIMIINC